MFFALIRPIDVLSLPLKLESLIKSLLNIIATAATVGTMSVKLTMKGKLLIRRFNLESVIIDGNLNRFKDPQLVIKPELEPAIRQPSTSSHIRNRPPTRRQVLMIHVKDKANELEKLYLDTFSSSSEFTNPAQRHSVICSRLECSLVFRYSKSDNDNRPRTLMVRFRATADLDAAMDELKTSGVGIEDASVDTQGLGRMAVHPQLQHLAVLDQSARSLPLASQQPYYQASPHLIMAHGFTPPPGVFRAPPSQPTGHFVNIHPGIPSWSPPPRPATTTGIPGILGEGIYKVSRVGSSSSNRSRGKRLPTISESQGQSENTVSRHFTRKLERAESLSNKRSFHRDTSQTMETADRKAKLARLLSEKYSNTSRISTGTGGSLVNDPTLPSGRPFPSSKVEDSARKTSDMDSTDIMATSGHRELRSSLPPRQTLGLTDLEELFNESRPKTVMPPPSTPRDRIIQEFMITQEGLTEATNIWNELMERGQLETEGIDDLGEAQKIWAKLGHEWIQQLQSKVSATVSKLRKVRCTGER